MASVLRPRTLVLFAGDVAFFAFSLWGALFLRELAFPSKQVFLAHLEPFSYLFALWLVVFFIAGLYESRSIVLARRAFSATLFVAQVVNVVLAAIFFFAVPIFGIAPKTVLLIYLAVSFPLVLIWRVFIFPWLGLQKPVRALLVGEGPEVDELVHALRHAPRAPMRLAEAISPGSVDSVSEVVRTELERRRASIVVADFSDTRVSGAFPELYNLLSLGIRFFDALSLYEQVFGRVPLSKLSDAWVAQNISAYARLVYDSAKRLIDIVAAVFGGIATILLTPFVAAAIVLESGRPVFIRMNRIGVGGRTIQILKFRSMSGNDGGNYGPGGATKLSVTRVGRILRLTSIDELPQFWNVLTGDLSLIGPRPETPALVAVYRQEIPYYDVRHLIKPGLSGWAQIYHHNDPHHGTAVDATREKLSYDLYYLKHRSLLLDLTIMLKTIKKLLTRNGV